ncbi:hypothetical protein [Herbiconiux solani]|uniref:hypothetical protein n=1 Tax=Herbiconiux solani TaxID=661329 RepID=UPI0008255990|nr:hypothetical protein [Herbiconiux solani]
MSYWALNAIFLAVVVVVAVVGIVRALRVGHDPVHPDARRRAQGRTTHRTTGRTLGAFGIALALLLVLTAVFDNVMIGIGLVGYDPDLISGAFIGIAPLEDFAYAIAAAVLLPSLWLLLERRPRS